MARTSRRKTRLYWRDRGGARRAYGDFRDYIDVGGRREPLVVAGERLATTDPDVAARLIAARLGDLETARHRRGLTGKAEEARLGTYARDYLIAKKRAGRVTDSWLAMCEVFLKRAVGFFGGDRPLEGIKVSDVRAWSAHLLASTGKNRRPFSPETVRRHLFTLSNLYRFAQEAEFVPPGFNPVAVLRDKPRVPKREAQWLEVPDASLLLASARTLPTVRTPAGHSVGAEMAYPLLAAFLLTGGRRGEVLGLQLEDVSFDRRTVTFRPNRWRRLKNDRSWRVVPLWPQLEEVLRPWVFGPRLDRGGSLLFPSPYATQEAPLTEIRKILDRVATRVGWKRRELNARAFRHTYCAARLQTLDNGAPVSVYTVARELGHGSENMVRDVYSHLGAIRHRAEVPEFRVEQHLDVLGDRVAGVAFGTIIDTTAQDDPATRRPRAAVSEREAVSYE